MRDPKAHAKVLAKRWEAALDEIERLHDLTTITDDMVDRAAHGIAAHWHDMSTNESLGRQRALARAALEAALTPKEPNA